MSILDLAKQGESSLLVGSKRKVGTETLWSGQFHSSRQHIAWARNCIGSSSCSSRSSNLDGYHNKCQLRHGDMVDVKDPNKIECGKLRNDAWDPKQTQIISYKHVGAKGPRGEVELCLGRTHRQTMLLSASAHLHRDVQNDELDINVIKPCYGKQISCLLLQRHHDSTPTHVLFGSLQHAIAPHARYLWKDSSGWKALQYDDWMARTRRKALPGRGVIQLLAQQANIDWVSADDEPLWGGMKLLCPPCGMQDGKSSTLMTAVDEAVYGFACLCVHVV